MLTKALALPRAYLTLMMPWCCACCRTEHDSVRE
jgi:hypothetical protein